MVIATAISSALATPPNTSTSKTPLRFRHPDYSNEPLDSDDSAHDDSDGEGETTAVDEAGGMDDDK